MANDGQNQPSTLDEILPEETNVNDELTPDTQGADRPEPQPQRPQRGEEADETREEADIGDKQYYPDTKRDALYAKAKAAREGKGLEEYDGNPNSAKARYGNLDGDDELGDLEKEALRRQQAALGLDGDDPPPAAQQPKKPLNGMDPSILGQEVIIKVDGVEQRVKVEDLTRSYQTQTAAEKRLQEANILLQSTKEIVSRLPKPQAEGDNEDTGHDLSRPEEEDGNTPPPNAKELIDKIQLGTPDEALGALSSFVNSMMKKTKGNDEERISVLTVLDQENAREGLQRVAKKYPLLQQDADIQSRTAKFIHRGMAEDLLKLGYTREDIRTHIAGDINNLIQLHKSARLERRGVRNAEQLAEYGYQQAVKSIRDTARMLDGNQQQQPQNQRPAGGMQQRQERKASLPTQPTPRRLDPSIRNQQSAPKTQEQSRKAALENMRIARQRPSIG